MNSPWQKPLEFEVSEPAPDGRTTETPAMKMFCEAMDALKNHPDKDIRAHQAAIAESMQEVSTIIQLLRLREQALRAVLEKFGIETEFKCGNDEELQLHVTVDPQHIDGARLGVFEGIQEHNDRLMEQRAQMRDAIRACLDAMRGDEDEAPTDYYHAAMQQAFDALNDIPQEIQ